MQGRNVILWDSLGTGEPFWSVQERFVAIEEGTPKLTPEGWVEAN